MPLLGDEDLFRGFGSNTAGYPESLFVWVDAQLRQLRPDYKSQRIVQASRPKETVTDKEEIQATISADVSDGHNAQLDASLKLLSEDDPKLLLPNDLEDDEIHILEAPGTGLSGVSPFTSAQDYLMQINEKRLLRARQEQKHPRPSSPFDEVAAAKESKRRHRTDAMMGKDQAEASHQQQPSLAVEASALHIPTAKRQKRHTSPSRETGNIDLINSSGLAAAVPVSHHCIRDDSSRCVHMLIVTSMYHTITAFFTQSHATKIATRGSMEA